MAVVVRLNIKSERADEQSLELTTTMESLGWDMSSWNEIYITRSEEKEESGWGEEGGDACTSPYVEGYRGQGGE